jgi:hypothetical protein
LHDSYEKCTARCDVRRSRGRERNERSKRDAESERREPAPARVSTLESVTASCRDVCGIPQSAAEQ